MVNWPELKAADNYNFLNPVFEEGKPQTLVNLISIDVAWVDYNRWSGIGTPTVDTVSKDEVLTLRKTLNTREVELADLVSSVRNEKLSMDDFIATVAQFIGG